MKTILRELMSNDAPITGAYLATINQVTPRTTREDIRNLASVLTNHGASIDSVMGKGYQLKISDSHQFQKYLQASITPEGSQYHVVPKSPEDRVAYIIKRLLLNEGYLKLDDLADEMFISKSTTQNDLRHVRQILSNYEIYLESRPNYGLKAIGSELKMRFCLAENVFDRKDGTPEQRVGTKLYPLPKQKIDRIQEIILRQIKENDITLSDIAIHNLLIHIAIACKRIIAGNHVSLIKTDMQEVVQQKEYGVAKKIVAEVEEAFDVTFPKAEVAYVAIHLIGTKMLSKTKVGNTVVEQVVNDEILELVKFALEKIQVHLNLDLKYDQELIIALSLHLKPAINRYKFGMNIRNPLLADIKKNYPLAFEAGIIAGLAIEEKSGTEIDENEVGYLALHIGAAIEREKMKSGPKRCLIVCASGLGTAKLIFYKLKNHFGKSLDVIGTTEYYNLSQYNLHEVDFIISSIPIAEELPAPVVEVNAIVGDNDLAKIEKHLIHDKHNVRDYFREDLMFFRKDFQIKEEALQFINKALRNKGLVEPTFLEAIYERESVAPTSFGNLVAIPHPIKPKSVETFLTVCTLARPIDWQGEPVQFICVLCVKKGSQEDLQAMYKLLGKIIDSSSLVHRLIKVQSFAEFMDVLFEKN